MKIKEKNLHKWHEKKLGVHSKYCNVNRTSE